MRDATTSVADAVPDVGRLGGIDHLADLEFDEPGQNVEQAATVAEEDRNLVDLDFVENASL